jgi:3'-phosphoadenosine 5'-phosphosulfate sulfotransferase (PAPS reductase)/FAD synthetase
MSNPGYNWVNVSGGKDSTALLLWAKEEELPNARFLFADTKNESPILYEYLDYLEEATGVKIERVETEGFLEMCKRKGRFPSSKARFCTQELKLYPMARYMEEAAPGDVHMSISGVRREESAARAAMPETERNDIKVPGFGTVKVMAWRPIIDWDWKEVFDIHRRHDIKPNPLYKVGMSRVGCFPCIMARKHELREMFRRFPETVDKLREWESQVGEASKRGESSFFPWTSLPVGVEGGIDTFAAYLDKGDVFPEFEEEFDGCTSQ